MDLRPGEHRRRRPRPFYEDLTHALAECVRRTAYLDRRNAKGAKTLRERLTEEYDKTGFLSPLLQEPEVPPAGEHILQAFWWLAARRPRYGMDASPGMIVMTEIEAYLRLLDLEMGPMEIVVLCRVDAAYLSAINDPNEPKVDWVPATADNVKRIFRMMMRQPKTAPRKPKAKGKE